MKKYVIFSVVVFSAFVMANSAQAGLLDFFGLGKAEVKRATEVKKRNPDASPKAAKASARSVDVACVKSALDKRDTAIETSVDAYHVAVSAALKIRKEAFKAAWDNLVVTDRNAAMRAATAAYQMSVKDARTAMKTSHRTIWDQYKTDMKACKAQPSDEGGSIQLDVAI